MNTINLPHNIPDDMGESQSILSLSHGMDPIVTLLTENLPKESSIFDVGAGHGRNSIPLAQMGYRVSTSDLSLTTLRTNALIRNLCIEYYEWDILNHSFDWEYDAFVCMRVLHFLESDEAKYIIQKMQNHTKPGWFNALTFFTDATPHNPKWFFPNLEDVTTLYCDWRLLIVSDPITSSPSETTWWREMVSVSCLFQKI